MKPELEEVEASFTDNGQKLSNLNKFIVRVLKIANTLGSEWENDNFVKRQAIQNLVLPDDIFYDKEKDGYLTDNVNDVFAFFRNRMHSY